MPLTTVSLTTPITKQRKALHDQTTLTASRTDTAFAMHGHMNGKSDTRNTLVDLLQQDDLTNKWLKRYVDKVYQDDPHTILSQFLISSFFKIYFLFYLVTKHLSLTQQFNIAKNN